MASSPGQVRKREVGPFLGVLIGALVGVSIALLGFYLAGWHARNMGWTLFLLVPICAGIAIALVTRKGDKAAAAAWLAVIVSLLILVATKMEGLLCALMAFVFVLAAVGIGILIGFLLEKLAKLLGRDPAMFRSVVFLALPLLIVGGHRAEDASWKHPRQEVVTNSIRLSAPPDQVWANIQSLDSLGGRKPLLMYVGLPIPMRCEMKGTGVGAKRTCYFDHGYIEETVLEWSPPYRMRLSIDRTNMPGRHWLEFEGAEYDLRADGTATVITRTTTIASGLYPAWYWQTLERWGVASEHEYLFRDLARRFSENSAQAGAR